MSDLAQKIVLITGAGWPPGRPIALAFADHDAQVLLGDLTPVNLDGIADEIRSRGSKTAIYTADISGKIPAQTMLTAILEEWGRIDILVNIIGIKPRAPLLDLDEWDWRRAMDVNLTGSFLMTQIVGRVMRTTGGGSILFIADAGENLGVNVPSAAFETGQTGLIGLTRSAAQELADHQIQVNALFQESTLESLPLANAAPEALSLLSGVNTLAEAAVRICAPPARSITGQVISIR